MPKPPTGPAPFPNIVLSSVPRRGPTAIEFVQAPRPTCGRAWRRYGAGHEARVSRERWRGRNGRPPANSFLVGDRVARHAVAFVHRPEDLAFRSLRGRDPAVDPHFHRGGY